jgi:hypothetical protein
VRVAAPRDADGGCDHRALPAESFDQRGGFDRRHAVLAQHLRSDEDVLDFGEDRLGAQERKEASVPGVVDLGGDAGRGGGRAPQDDLGVKVDGSPVTRLRRFELASRGAAFDANLVFDKIDVIPLEANRLTEAHPRSRQQQKLSMVAGHLAERTGITGPSSPW